MALHLLLAENEHSFRSRNRDGCPPPTAIPESGSVAVVWHVVPTLNEIHFHHKSDAGEGSNAIPAQFEQLAFYFLCFRHAAHACVLAFASRHPGHLILLDSPTTVGAKRDSSLSHLGFPFGFLETKQMQASLNYCKVPTSLETTDMCHPVSITIDPRSHCHKYRRSLLASSSLDTIARYDTTCHSFSLSTAEWVGTF
jgi:hypothetical protein